jgi:glyoxalase family protein
MPLHHVTAIAGNARQNLDFYTRILGLRLIKKTVNFDDPGTYHLYYGDDYGRPGTVLTFFPWANAVSSRKGTGEAVETAFCVPQVSLDFWQRHLSEQGIAGTLSMRFDQPCLTLSDPDGLNLALIESADVLEKPFWPVEPFISAVALRGFHSVTLQVAHAKSTAAILSDIFGMVLQQEQEGRIRFQYEEAVIDLVQTPQVPQLLQGRMGRGSVHHIAFCAKNDAEQAFMVQKLHDHHAIAATEQKDRQYFRSVYFREPSGVLFEIATLDPGFMVDETYDKLGKNLMLPLLHEPRRAEIEAALPPL